MRLLKHKNYEKYLSARETTRAALKDMRQWKDNSLINMLDLTYKVASFFHNYYVNFHKKSSF